MQYKDPNTLNFPGAFVNPDKVNRFVALGVINFLKKFKIVYV
jgi:hypothetical protein